MVDKPNKSHFTQKNAEKEIQTPEEIQLKKLEDIVHKLQNAIEKGNNLELTHQEQNKRNTTNKSNFSSPTSTRMKEDRSDREFLSNFMNVDEKNAIPPKKMHLLTDNDTNQNITAREKFQNLSNLMMDDKNITEFNFIRNSEDRVKLYLYSAFSKKSKEIFMNENHPKQSKNQILFHKINDIHIPKFGYFPPLELNKENKLDENNIKDNNNINKTENNNEDKNKNDDKKFDENYFRKEDKGYFHIPSLIKINSEEEYKKPKKEDNIFWDPEIDSDTLSYINHNFICIEDIYNSKNTDEKYTKSKTGQNKNEDIEHNLTPIVAKEVIFEKEPEMVNNFFEQKDGKNKEKKQDKANNKFIEFIAINAGVEKQQYQVMPNIKSKEKFHSQLKIDFNELINKYIEIDKNEYPKGANLTPRKIERYLRFKLLRQVSRQIDFSLEGKSTEQSIKEKDKEKKEDKNIILIDNEFEQGNSTSHNLKLKSDKNSNEEEKFHGFGNSEEN